MLLDLSQVHTKAAVLPLEETGYKSAMNGCVQRLLPSVPHSFSPARLEFLLILQFLVSIILAVISVCSDDWLIVRIERRPFGNDTELRVDDTHLGDNCSVTRVLSFNYEFSYPAVSCGINKFVFQGNVFIFSEIRYRLVQELTRRFQVICSVKRPKLFLMEPFGLNRYSGSAFCGGSQVIGQEPSVYSQSETREPNFSSSRKDQLPVNLWISSPCVKNSFVP